MATANISGSRTNIFIDLTSLELEAQGQELMDQAEIEAKTHRQLFGGTMEQAWDVVISDLEHFDDPDYGKISGLKHGGMFKRIKSNIQRTIREQTKGMVAQPVEQVGRGETGQLFFWELGIVRTDHCDDCYRHSRMGAKTRQGWLDLGRGLPRWGMTECNIGCRCMLRPTGKGGGTTKQSGRVTKKGKRRTTKGLGKGIDDTLKDAPVSTAGRGTAKEVAKKVKEKIKTKRDPILAEDMAGKHKTKADAMSWAEHQSKQGKVKYQHAPRISDLPPNEQKIVKAKAERHKRLGWGKPTEISNHRFGDRGNKDYGKFDYKKAQMTVEQCNQYNLWLKEANNVCDMLGIPRLRGMTNRTGTAHANMGDGVMGWNWKSFDYHGGKGKQWSKKGYDQEWIDSTLNSYRMGQYNGLHPERPTDIRVPHTTSGYFIKKKMTHRDSLGAPVYKYIAEIGHAESSFWHEFGHHVHQQKGVKNWNDYAPTRLGLRQGGKTPMEKKVETIFSRLGTSHLSGGLLTPKNESIIFPSSYSKSSASEWFAENYSQYKMGLKVHPEFVKFLVKEGIE
jgi:hypothetical protein